MAIKITEDGAVRYVNENNVDRTMFPNLTGAMGDEQYDALNGRLTVVEGKVSDLEECCGDVNNDITELKNYLNQKADKTDALSAYVIETATGSIASFSDGADDVPVKDLTVAIEPVQDLHGYDNPWPAGGGKNLTDYDTDLTSQAGINMEAIILFSVVLTAGKTYTISCKQSVAVPTSTRNTLAIKPSNGTYTYESTTENFNPANLRHTLTYTPQSTGQYEVAFWPHTPSVSATYNEWQVEESGSFTSYAPYSNICPISGWTGANVVRTGKNLLNLVESEMILSGWNRAFPISVKEGTYIISCQNDFGASTALGVSVAFVGESGETIKGLTVEYNFGINNYRTGIPATITAEESSRIKRILFRLRAGNTSYADIAQGNLQLELGSTATAYEPYQGSTVSVDWTTEAGTVYGGTLDVTAGVLTVDRGYIASYNGETLPSTWISDRDVYASGTTPTTGAQVVYTLASPQTYQLTPQEVSTVLGQNNIFADTGNVTVQYRADTKLYIDKVLNA